MELHGWRGMLERLVKKHAQGMFVCLCVCDEHDLCDEYDNVCVYCVCNGLSVV